MTSFPKDAGDQLETLTSLSGTSIRDSQGTLVGTVADLIVDVSEARLAYLSIALHPPDGGDDTLHVTVPWSIVSIERGVNRGLRVAVRRNTLRRMAETVSARCRTARRATRSET